MLTYAFLRRQVAAGRIREVGQFEAEAIRLSFQQGRLPSAIRMAEEETVGLSVRIVVYICREPQTKNAGFDS